MAEVVRGGRERRVADIRAERARRHLRGGGASGRPGHALVGAGAFPFRAAGAQRDVMWRMAAGGRAAGTTGEPRGRSASRMNCASAAPRATTREAAAAISACGAGAGAPRVFGVSGAAPRLRG